MTKRRYPGATTVSALRAMRIDDVARKGASCAPYVPVSPSQANHIGDVTELVPARICRENNRQSTDECTESSDEPSRRRGCYDRDTLAGFVARSGQEQGKSGPHPDTKADTVTGSAPDANSPEIPEGSSLPVGVVAVTNQTGEVVDKWER